LYGIIARLESAGLIRAVETADSRRRPYRITPEGKRAFGQRVAHLKSYERALRMLATP